MPQSAARHYALIRKDAPQAEVDALVAELKKVRGMHAVTATMQTEWVNRPTAENPYAGGSEPTGWRKLFFRGTDRAVLGGKNVLAFSSLQELDPNADHDHAKCIASARAMGVPEAWAHRPETYLSV